MAAPRRCASCPTVLSRYNPGERCARCEAAAEVAKQHPWDGPRPRISLEPWLGGRVRARQAKTPAQTAARRSTVKKARAARQAATSVDFGAMEGCGDAG